MKTLPLPLQRVFDAIWRDDLELLRGLRRQLIVLLRILMLVGRDLARGMLTLRAMSLVYTTLLSFVPLLAVSFSVLKGFGVHNQIEPFLLELLQPLGDKGQVIAERIVGFVEQVNIRVLGALGVAMLLFTVMSLIHKIEAAFNYTWRIQGARRLSQRFSNYLSVVLVGPVLVFAAMALTATLKSQAVQNLPWLSEGLWIIGVILQYAMIIGAFTFVYLLVPNTRVHFRSALYGAVIAGLSWRAAGLLFAGFAASSTSYTAIYSSFAILLLFMIWLFVGWLILLVGASIAYYHQHPEMLRWEEELTEPPPRLREAMLLQLMRRIAVAFERGEPPLASDESLMQRLGIGRDLLQKLLAELRDSGLIQRSERGHWLPARSVGAISLAEILRVAREGADHAMLARYPADDAVAELQHDWERCIEDRVGDKTLKDWIESS